MHFFFADQDKVDDRIIINLIEQTLDRDNPREWYYALFDYGAMLKKTHNLESKSAHYRKQSPFAGSNRELRSKIIKLLITKSSISEEDIAKRLNRPPEHIHKNLIQLRDEGFISITKDKISIA